MDLNAQTKFRLPRLELSQQRHLVGRLFLIFLVAGCLQASATDRTPENLWSENNIPFFQTRISGQVVNSQGEPLSGVSVVVKGTNQGTTTNDNGAYNINAERGQVLQFTFVGFDPVESTIGNSNVVNISMNASAVSDLDEVVVVGYGSLKRSEVTGASTTVGEKTIKERPITQLDQALQGTVAGVMVTSGNGQPGNELMVKIRGANSITGSNEPLYVIDGNIGQGSDVNVDDVESIEILKDAASTAIYGSRGSNGVVLITTKSGKIGRAKVEFNAWTQRSEIPKRIDLMDGYDFARSVNAQFLSTGNAIAFTDADLQRLKETGGTDWVGAITRKPWTQNYDLSVSGGTEGARYRFSAGYLDQPGVLINQYHRRASFRGKVDFKLGKKINVDVNLSTRIPKNHNNGYGSGLTVPFNQAADWDPTSPIRDPNTGEFIPKSPYASIQFNPVAQASSQVADRITTISSGNVTLVYNIFPFLTFTTTDVYNVRSGLNQSVYGPGTANYQDGTDYAVVSNSRSTGYLSSNYLTYKKDFGDHHIIGTALYELSAGRSVNSTSTSRNLSTYSLGYYNLGLGATQTTSSGYTEDALISYLGRINYSYKDKYYLTASVRTDGSSHLTKKYSWFPAVGFKWNVSREDFMANSNLFSNFALRLSYGQTGNQAVPSFATIPLINIRSGQPNYYFDGSTPSVATELGAPVSDELRWEVKSSYDMGLDMAFLHGRLNLTIDAYYNKVHDLLYSYQAPFYIGGGTYSRNIGEIENKGLEVALTGFPTSSASRVNWNTTLTISVNRNKVVNLGGLDDVIRGGTASGLAMLSVGRPLGEFLGMQYLGTWKSHEADEAAKFGMQPGDPKYVDVNGDFAYSAADYLPIGNGTPDFGFGFINNVSYKAFTLNVMFQGTYGNDIFSQTIAYAWGGLGDVKNATYAEAIPENLWTPDHETDNPAWSSTGKNYNTSSRYVYNASYIKLKNLSLTYNVPLKKISKGLVDLDVYISTQNLFTITNYPGYDPETYNGGDPTLTGIEFGMIPNPRTFTFGLKLGL